MTIRKAIGILTFSCLLIPVLKGQGIESETDSFHLSAEQWKLLLQPMVADSAGSALKIPNVFTPNGDGVNDHFEVTTDGTTIYILRFFTRTGTQVFYTKSQRIFWDGNSSSGMELPEGI